MKFTSKQVVTMVVAGCVAIILAPVTVFAATGQLVNIADPSTGKGAIVTNNGALLVESRAAQGLNAFNMHASRYQFGWIPLAATTGPQRLAITELTLAGPFDTVGNAGEVLVEAFVRTSGTAPCTGPGAAGYTRHTLKHVWVPARETIQLLWNGPSLVLPPAAAGQPLCFGVTYYAGNTNMTIYADGTGYKFG
jgi:hypothetical protein